MALPPQGPPLAANLAAFLSGQPPQAFTPQARRPQPCTLAMPIPHAAPPCRYQWQPLPLTCALCSPTGPQATALALISLGGRACVASRTGGLGGEWPLGWLLNGGGGAALAATGLVLWAAKDLIDRAFMARWLGESQRARAQRWGRP
jgi:hypothetical protein